MAQIDIPFPVTTAKDSPARGGVGRMVNALMEQLPDGGVNRKRAPGVTLFAQSASNSVHCRGFVLANDNQLVVIYNGFAEVVDPVGNSTALGPINGSKIVTIAKNNKTPTPDIVCVTDTSTYALTTSAAPIPYPDANVDAPNSVCFGDGYFFFTYGSGACRASGLNATSINPLDVIVVNSTSTTLLRGIYFAQTLFLFTEATIEAWTDTANPVGFPFSRSAVIPRGLISATAVAGEESQFTATLIFVGNDNIVYLMQGYSPRRISTSDIERRISNVADKSTLRASVYTSEGHAIWQLTCSDFTLIFDITNSYWAERDSVGFSFSRIECGAFAFGYWIVGDYATGRLGRINANVFTEYGATLSWRMESSQMHSFPQQMTIRRGDFNFITGTGLLPTDDSGNPVTQFASAPQVQISWSDDGGATYTMPLLRGLGELGICGNVVTVLRTGQTSRYGRVWRLEVTDPVYVGLLSATMEAI